MRKEEKMTIIPSMGGFSMDSKKVKFLWPVKRTLLIPMPWTYSVWIKPKYRNEFNFWFKVKMFFSLLLSGCKGVFSEWKENT